jgi:diadenosine tetraphosphatase ApaH/serine/threonine PP2A family protein phosphatase
MGENTLGLETNYVDIFVRGAILTINEKDEMMTKPITVAIADIHGRADLLQALNVRIAEIASEYEADPEIIYLGDICDRGPDSRTSMEMVHRAVSETGAIVIKGNHDNWFYEAISEGCDIALRKWLDKGGVETLASYLPGCFNDSIDFILRKFQRHLDLIAGAKPYHVSNGVCFTHAGIDPSVALADQDEYNLMWIRGEFLDHVGYLDHIVVHGHTVVGNRPVVTENRISLDTGSFKTGRLTAMIIDWEKETVRFIQTDGDASSVIDIEPEFLDRGLGLATEFLFQHKDFRLAA